MVCLSCFQHSAVDVNTAVWLVQDYSVPTGHQLPAELQEDICSIAKGFAWLEFSKGSVPVEAHRPPDAPHWQMVCLKLLEGGAVVDAATFSYLQRKVGFGEASMPFADRASVPYTVPYTLDPAPCAFFLHLLVYHVWSCLFCSVVDTSGT